jgi:hypothetical protein
LTDNYLRVQATAPGEINLTNRITPAQLVSLEAGRIHADLSPALVE